MEATGLITSSPPKRECGECTMCCKLLGIRELEKPANKWCQYCAIGIGCKIHTLKPSSCTDFECLWLQHPEVISEGLRPDKTKVVFFEVANDTVAIQACIDPARPDALHTDEMRQLTHNIILDGKIIAVSCGEIKWLLGEQSKLAAIDGVEINGKEYK